MKSLKVVLLVWLIHNVFSFYGFSQSLLCQEIQDLPGAEQILQGLKNHQSDIFHPRLNGNTNKVLETTMKQLKEMTGSPFELSIHSRFIVKSQNSSEKILCQNEENPFWVYPLHGYESQAIIWINVFGEKNLGKIFLHLVKDPREKRSDWMVGVFHSQKWTEQKKTPYQWYEESQKDSNPIISFINSDISRKLFSGGGRFYEFLASETVIQNQKMNQGQSKAIAAMTNTLKEQSKYPILSLEGLFATNGIGIGLKFQVPDIPSGKNTKEHCQNILKEIKTQTWFSKEYQGLRCSYYLPQESTEKDGVLGSLWLTVSSEKQGLLQGFSQRFWGKN